MGNDPWNEGYYAGRSDYDSDGDSSYDNQYNDFDAMEYQEGYEQGLHEAEIDDME